MLICSLSRPVGIDSFTAHDEQQLKLQINNPPLLEYILQKYKQIYFIFSGINTKILPHYRNKP